MDGIKYKLALQKRGFKHGNPYERDRLYAEKWAAEQQALHQQAGGQLMDGATPAGMEVAAEKTKEQGTER